MEEHKTCYTCKKTRSLIAFFRDRRKADGYEANCKSCRTKIRQARVKKIRVHVSEKICSRCSEVKSLEEFHKNAMSRDGHHFYCKSCILKYNQKHREADPLYKIKNQVKNKLSREAADPDLRRERARAYYAKNRTRIRLSRKRRIIREAMQNLSADT